MVSIFKSESCELLNLWPRSLEWYDAVNGSRPHQEFLLVYFCRIIRIFMEKIAGSG